MILVTVGTQLPFDRLIELVDGIAPDLAEPVFAQTGGGAYRPRHMEWSAHVGAAEFERQFASASLVIGHAGIGTILMAQRHQKPLILVARKASLGEHRNDHQVATAAAVEGRQGIYLAQDADQLRALLRQTLLRPRETEAAEPRRQLLAAVSDFIEDKPMRRTTDDADAPRTSAPTG